MSALLDNVGYCTCPDDVPGRPGIDCPDCGLMRSRDNELAVRYDDANALCRAAGRLDTVIGNTELCAEDGLAELAKVEADLIAVLANVQKTVHDWIDELSRERQHAIEARLAQRRPNHEDGAASAATDRRHDHAR